MKDRVTALLDSQKLKKTPARMAVLRVFINEQVAHAQSDLEKAISEETDRVTIYRTLNTFEEKGLIHKVFDGSGVAKYALCDEHCHDHSHDDDHVHFKCTECGNTFCLENVEVPTIKAPDGYQLKEWHFFASGICKNCAA